MDEQEKPIIYPLSMKMSEVRDAYADSHDGEWPRVVLHTEDGWLIANDLDIEFEDLKDDE